MQRNKTFKKQLHLSPFFPHPSIDFFINTVCVTDKTKATNVFYPLYECLTPSPFSYDYPQYVATMYWGFFYHLAVYVAKCSYHEPCAQLYRFALQRTMNHEP